MDPPVIHDFESPQDCACHPFQWAGIWTHLDPNVPRSVAYVLPRGVASPCTDPEPHASHGYYPGTCPGVPG